MANDPKRFKQGLVLDAIDGGPNPGTDAAFSIEGHVYVYQNKIKSYVEAALREVATLDQIQAFTNKTIGDTNTINAQEDAFVIQAAADPTLQLDFNVTGDTGTKTTIQSTQTATDKTITLPDATDTLVARATADTLTNKTIVAANNTITTAASGNLTSSELNAALAELQTDVDTRAPQTEVDNHRTYTGSTGAADVAPAYTSSIRGVAGESLISRSGTMTDAIGDAQEDRSAFMRSIDSVTWEGTQISFTTDMVLEILNTKSGTATTHTVALADSPVAIANGESLYLTIDRTINETISLINSGTTPIPAQTQAGKDTIVLFKRVDELGVRNLYLPFTKQFVTEGSVFKLGDSSSSGGIGTKASFRDPLSTTLPTGATVTIDGVAGVNGDTVLFTNLATNNNRIYELSGVGSSIAWSALSTFNYSLDPADGDSVRIQKGDIFADQLAVFNGTDFRINDIVRYFDGTGADFVEMGSIKTSTLADNTTGTVFSVNVTGSENVIVSYSIERGASKETGDIHITSDGTSATMSRNSTYILDTGIAFSTAIAAGNLELNYTSTSTGSAATMKYFVKRWSNSAGGPTGIPNYSGATGSTITAAGSDEYIQFNTANNLDANVNFKWSTAENGMNLNGIIKTALSSAITLNDNQVAPLSIINYDNTLYKHIIIEYSVDRGGEHRTGRLLVSNDSTTKTGFSDDFVETTPVGISFSATNGTGLVNILYTSTSTGTSGTFKYTITKWL